MARLNKNGNVPSEAKINSLKTIYCNQNGEIVINLKNVKFGDRKIEAKRQFENIIKCGLITGVPQYYYKDQTGVFLGESRCTKFSPQATFNPFMYSTPFVNIVNLNKVHLRRGNDGLTDPKERFKDDIKNFIVGENQYFAIHKDWQMPGISACILQDSTDEIPVYCGMKTSGNAANMDLNKLNYYENYVGQFSNREHTERQLYVNSKFEFAGKVKIDEKKHNLLSGVGDAGKSLAGSNMLIYTYGNPCTVGSRDNGGTCCTKWYREIPIECESIDIYFSEIQGNHLDMSYKQDIQDCQTLFSEILHVSDLETLKDKLQECKQKEIIKQEGKNAVEDVFNKKFAENKNITYHVIVPK